MNFEKTFEKYIEYKSQKFIYDCLDSNIRTDEEIIEDEDLLTSFSFMNINDNSFNVNFFKKQNISNDKCIDLTRLVWLKNIQEIFEFEYQKNIESEVYFIGCHFKVYEKTYPLRLKEFQEKFTDALEIDFIKEEYIDVNVDGISKNKSYSYFPITLTNEIYRNKKYSLKKREKFLKSKMLGLGYEVMYYDEDISSYYEDFTTTETKYSIIKKQELSNINLEPAKKEIAIIDLSDSKGTEKIIMLYKLGFFDFLRTKEPFNASKNALASVLSGVTGIDLKTIQSYINPINNPTVDQKNNPLIREKTVNKVCQKLSSIGYNLQE